MLSITEEAALHIRKFFEGAGWSGENKFQPVRLSLKPTKACADLKPLFTPNAKVDPDEDTLIEVSGLNLVCDMHKLPVGITDLSVVLEEHSLGKVLVLRGNNLESCGCGQAVRVSTPL